MRRDRLAFSVDQNSSTGLLGAPAFGSVCASSGGLCSRRCPTGELGHVRSCAKESAKQARYGKIDVERFPVQSVTRSLDFDLGNLITGRMLKTLCKSRRKSKRASIRKINDHSISLSIKAYS